MDNVQDRKLLLPNFTNKFVYAFTGTGKSEASLYNDKLLETDYLMCKIFDCHPKDLYEKMVFFTKVYPDTKAQKIDFLKKQVDHYLNNKFTLLSSNEELLLKAEIGILPEELNYIHDRLLSKNRSNPYNKDIKILEKNLKRVESKLKNLNIPIIYLPKEKYISDIIFQ